MSGRVRGLFAGGTYIALEVGDIRDLTEPCIRFSLACERA